MIEFANGLDRLLQLLVVVQPAAGLGDALATHAELPRVSTSIGDRQNKHPVPFATRAFRAVFGMSDGALQQRATQQFAGDRQLADKASRALERIDLRIIYKSRSDRHSPLSISIPAVLAVFHALSDSPATTEHFNFAPESS